MFFFLYCKKKSRLNILAMTCTCRNDIIKKNYLSHWHQISENNVGFNVQKKCVPWHNNSWASETKWIDAETNEDSSERKKYIVLTNIRKSDATKSVPHCDSVIAETHTNSELNDSENIGIAASHGETGLKWKWIWLIVSSVIMMKTLIPNFKLWLWRKRLSVGLVPLLQLLVSTLAFYPPRAICFNALVDVVDIFARMIICVMNS